MYKASIHKRMLAFLWPMVGVIRTANEIKNLIDIKKLRKHAEL